MTLRHRWMTLATAALLGAAVLGGCSDDADGGEPTTTSAAPTSASPSPSPTASPSASPTGPVVPEAAKANTPAGAEAFIRYYIELVNRAYTAPASGLLAPLSDPGCQFCQASEKDAAGLVERRHRYATPPLVLGPLKQEQASGSQVIFAAELSQNAAQVVDATGKLVRAETAKSLPVRAAVTWNGSSWRFFDLESRS